MMKYRRNKGLLRVLVLILCILLVMSISGVTVFAEDEQESVQDQMVQAEEDPAAEEGSDETVTEDTEPEDSEEKEAAEEPKTVEEPEASKEPEAAEEPEEIPDVIVVRISGNEVTVNGHPAENSEELKSRVGEYADGVRTFELEENRAILETYRWVVEAFDEMEIYLKEAD